MIDSKLSRVTVKYRNTLTGNVYTSWKINKKPYTDYFKSIGECERYIYDKFNKQAIFKYTFN